MDAKALKKLPYRELQKLAKVRAMAAESREGGLLTTNGRYIRNMVLRPTASLM